MFSRSQAPARIVVGRPQPGPVAGFPGGGVDSSVEVRDEGVPRRPGGLPHNKRRIPNAGKLCAIKLMGAPLYR
jgi:hypothetical protein